MMLMLLVEGFYFLNKNGKQYSLTEQKKKR